MYTIISDGGKRRDITYGSYKIFDSDGKELVHRQIVYGYGTSNLSEYLIMIDAVKHAQSMGIKNVAILTDSRLVRMQTLGEWACNYDHLRTARNKLRRLLKGFDHWEINKITRNIVASHLGH
jgi:ribonuclease HI